MASQTYNDDEEKKEQECQRTGATADFWTSIGEATVYVVVYFLPSQVSRYVLVFIAVASTIVVAVISATYRQQDLLHKDELPDADRVGEGGKRRSTLRISNAAEADTLLTSGGSSWADTRRKWCSCEEASMPYRALQCVYVVAAVAVCAGLTGLCGDVQVHPWCPGVLHQFHDLHPLHALPTAAAVPCRGDVATQHQRGVGAAIRCARCL